MINPQEYLDARKIWKDAGEPIRSQEEIDRIFAQCKSNECGQYKEIDKDHGSCGICGCYLSNKLTTKFAINPKYLFNKIEWGTTECPHENKYWGAESTEDKTDQSQQAETAEEVNPPPPPPCGCGS